MASSRELNSGISADFSTVTRTQGWRKGGVDESYSFGLTVLGTLGTLVAPEYYSSGRDLNDRSASKPHVPVLSVLPS